MEIESHKIIFKSTIEHFAKERSGMKRNTVRVLNTSEHNQVQNWIKKHPTKKKKIVIYHEDSENCQESFSRDLTDITVLISDYLRDYYLYIFSW
ncbi:MAG: hypothetical protein SVY15_04095 [Halobacteriota archaeon]|nr:hypothetical protein [Halobacteriota archaeon]